MSGGAGFDYVPATLITPAQHAPGFSGAADWVGAIARFIVGYQRMFMPSFGYRRRRGESGRHRVVPTRRCSTAGGSTPTQSSRWRDNKPLLMSTGAAPPAHDAVPLAAIGYAPRPWVRVEGFYSRALPDDDSIPGGDIDRNRLGFVITTSRPVRMQ